MSVQIKYDFGTDRHVVYCDAHGRIEEAETPEYASMLAGLHADANGEEV